MRPFSTVLVDGGSGSDIEGIEVGGRVRLGRAEEEEETGGG